MTLRKNLILVAHPTYEVSSSQQFLIQSISTLAIEEEYEVVDLYAEYEQHQRQFDYHVWHTRLKEAHTIYLQFPLWWYQAPALLKEWIDEVLANAVEPTILQHKRFGVIVAAGVKESEFQSAGRVGQTMSSLLSPYEALASYYNMVYLKPFTIYQFDMKSEFEKQELMMRYNMYLATGEGDSFKEMQQFMLRQLNRIIQSSQSFEQQEKLRTLYHVVEEQASELSELYDLTDR